MNIELLKQSGTRTSVELTDFEEVGSVAFHTDALVTQLSQQFRDQFQASPLADLRQITVDAMGPRSVLSGCVDSFYHKQLALESVRFAFDLVEIIDDLRVVSVR